MLVVDGAMAAELLQTAAGCIFTEALFCVRILHSKKTSTSAKTPPTEAAMAMIIVVESSSDLAGEGEGDGDGPGEFNAADVGCAVTSVTLRSMPAGSWELIRSVAPVDVLRCVFSCAVSDEAEVDTVAIEISMRTLAATTLTVTMSALTPSSCSATEAAMLSVTSSV